MAKKFRTMVEKMPPEAREHIKQMVAEAEEEMRLAGILPETPDASTPEHPKPLE